MGWAQLCGYAAKGSGCKVGVCRVGYGGQGGASSGFSLVSAMQPFLRAAAAKQRGSQQGLK